MTMKRELKARPASSTDLGRASVETKGPVGAMLDPFGKQFSGISDR
jgi:hypothetical protein